MDRTLEMLVGVDEPPEQTCSIHAYYASGEPDVGNGRDLHNPVAIVQENGGVYTFRVNSARELEELLTQAEQYGYAEARDGGWTVHVAPTAAMAQDAVEQDHQRHLVRWDLHGTNWFFTDTDIPLPVDGPAVRPLDPSAGLEDNQAFRAGPAREAPGTDGSLRDAAKRILAAVHPKRAPDHDVAVPGQGLSRGGPQW
ncbi:hypothetical protein ADL03_26950 [Nocardia sp. NRRL S-836]|nr:hypothetical protein ADL03_26950 [Nocardia sp. NRRL S-836]